MKCAMQFQENKERVVELMASEGAEGDDLVSLEGTKITDM